MVCFITYAADSGKNENNFKEVFKRSARYNFSLPMFIEEVLDIINS